MNKQQIEIAITLYKLGMDIEIIEKMTQVSCTDLFNELRKYDRK